MKVSQSQEDQIKRNWPPSLLWGFALTIMITTLTFDLQTPLGVACAVPYTLAVLVIAFTQSRRGVIGIAAITSLLTILGMEYSPNFPKSRFGNLRQIEPWHFSQFGLWRL